MGLFKVSTPLILVASFLFSYAFAAPAPRAIKARDYVTDIVTETIWETVDITTTVYVDELPSTSVPAATSAEVTSSAEDVETTSTSASVPVATSAPTSAGPVSAPASSEQVSSQEAPVASSSVAGEFAESSAPPVPETTAPTSSAPAYSPPASAPAAPTSSEAPAPASTSVAAPPPSPVSQAADNSGSSGGSESASCEGGSASCKGDVTHYDGGLGACGTNVDTEHDMVIALPFEFMGTASNSNPYCGRSVTVKTVSGSPVKGKVGDKCMGCVGRSIDLTNTMFSAVTDGKGDGRVHNIEWWFD